MNDIPLFDCLTHPMPSGDWEFGRAALSTRAETLREEMAAANVTRAFAVGMGPSIGGYREETYAGWVRTEIPGAWPVAFCNPCDAGDFGTQRREWLDRIKSLGYVGIKLHPRIGGFDYSLPELSSLIAAADGAGLFTMLCTYPYGKGADASRLGLSTILDVLREVGDSRVILLHGGLTQALEFSEAIRPWPNVLLDLSFALLRFRGSSFDLDARWLFENFDRRVCVGSDHPQFSPRALRSQFDALTNGLDRTKCENIAFRNLERFLAGGRP